MNQGWAVTFLVWLPTQNEPHDKVEQKGTRSLGAVFSAGSKKKRFLFAIKKFLPTFTKVRKNQILVLFSKLKQQSYMCPNFMRPLMQKKKNLGQTNRRTLQNVKSRLATSLYTGSFLNTRECAASPEHGTLTFWRPLVTDSFRTSFTTREYRKMDEICCVQWPTIFPE